MNDVAIIGVPDNFQLGSPRIDLISAALAKAQGEIRSVEVSAVGQDGNRRYKYAPLDAIYDASKEIVAKNRLAVVSRPLATTIHTILVHESGQWIDYGEFPIGQHEEHKERGSALTYTERYIWKLIFKVASREEDDDGEAGNRSLGRGAQPAPSQTRQPPAGQAKPQPASVGTPPKAIEEMTVEEMLAWLETIKTVPALKVAWGLISKCDSLLAMIANWEWVLKGVGAQYKNVVTAQGQRRDESLEQSIAGAIQKLNLDKQSIETFGGGDAQAGSAT